MPKKSTIRRRVVKLLRVRSSPLQQRARFGPGVLAVWLSLAGCSDGLQPAGVPIGDFGTEYAQTVCAQLAACCGEGSDAGTISDAGTTDASSCGERVGALVEATVENAGVYHAAVAGHCIDARGASRGCGRFEPSDICDDVFETPLLERDELGGRGVPLGLCTTPDSRSE